MTHKTKETKLPALPLPVAFKKKEKKGKEKGGGEKEICSPHSPVS